MGLGRVRGASGRPSPTIDDMKPTATIHAAEALTALRSLPDGCIRTCVTSPPYWGLRDYGHDGQLGLEATPDEYVANLVAVFREVRRVLSDDGTVWLNLGDSYSDGTRDHNSFRRDKAHVHAPGTRSSGLPPKNLVGIPWRVALALQADGWYLRQDIIWHKPSPMPESVRDRCTKAHEYIFLLSKSARYYFDAAAIAEPATGRASGNKRRKPASARGVPVDDQGKTVGDVAGSFPWAGSSTRNRRDVWTIPTKPFPGAHFATFPPTIPELCIRAGSAEGDTVLDPFAGSGTTGDVALRLKRHFIGVEINPDYASMVTDRIRAAGGMFASVEIRTYDSSQ